MTLKIFSLLLFTILTCMSMEPESKPLEYYQDILDTTYLKFIPKDLYPYFISCCRTAGSDYPFIMSIKRQCQGNADNFPFIELNHLGQDVCVHGFYNNNTEVIFSNNKGQILILEALTGKLIKYLEGGSSLWTRAFDYHVPTQRILVSYDKGYTVWNKKSGEIVSKYNCPDSTTAFFIGNGTRVISESATHTRSGDIELLYTIRELSANSIITQFQERAKNWGDFILKKNIQSEDEICFISRHQEIGKDIVKNSLLIKIWDTLNGTLKKEIYENIFPYSLLIKPKSNKLRYYETINGCSHTYLYHFTTQQKTHYSKCPICLQQLAPIKKIKPFHERWRYISFLLEGKKISTFTPRTSLTIKIGNQRNKVFAPKGYENSSKKSISINCLDDILTGQTILHFDHTVPLVELIMDSEDNSFIYIPSSIKYPRLYRIVDPQLTLAQLLKDQDEFVKRPIL